MKNTFFRFSITVFLLISLLCLVACGGGGGGGSSTKTNDMKEALKGKWYKNYSNEFGYDLPFYTSDDNKATYIQIGDENLFKRVWYETIIYTSIFTGDPNEDFGTWVYDDSKLYVTIDKNGHKVTVTYKVNLQNDILTLTYKSKSGNDTIIEIYKKTMPPKYTQGL